MISTVSKTCTEPVEVCSHSTVSNLFETTIFPTVSKEQVITLLEEIEKKLISKVA